MTVIQVQALSKTYGRSRGIQDLSFQVDAKQILGFLGPNGAGKTTTIRTLLGMLRPTSGTASILGLDIQKQSVEIRRKVGYLPGELNLYPDMNALDVLTYFASLRGITLPRLSHELIQQLQLDPKKPICKLSKGNKQKIGIIQAFMHDPQVLILDEPTSGLDPLLQHTFDGLILEAKKQGKAVLLSSHVLGEVDRTADQILIIKQGQVVAQRPLMELKNQAQQQVEVEFAALPPLHRLHNVPAVVESRIQGNTVVFTVTGNMDAFIKALAQYEVLTLRSLSANLESLFMDFYKEDSDVQRV
ncbi:ABC-2 type transport system ATP-binding protein [Deinobacterium chartae]|uniref:ABC-2 type transport system ATP-binding protein n=1 Tax=Deinobacterium chartae TaxID=521158 RepID=A0A841I5J6_9DEIO|nr:ABC transporter ATP-binding protein [Deinobacterium chartae]MBB6099718.1 ABC-2 type transport system ATP-binding protein [Deinobacterium chartae]